MAQYASKGNNMKPVVVVGESGYNRSPSVYDAEERFEIRVVPDDEASLAEAIRAEKCRAAIICGAPYTGPLYDALANDDGAIVARFGVGHDGVDKALCRERGIVVTNTPDTLDDSVAEHVFWLIGALAKRVVTYDRQVRAGDFTATSGVELSGKTLGVIGFGSIGSVVGRIASHGFGMRVIAAGRRSIAEIEHDRDASTLAGLDLYTHEADKVFEMADFISLNLPGGDDTRYFVDARRLALMKPTAFLINTARGSVVDEAALYDALASNAIAGAGLDVFDQEPYVPVAPDKDLRTLDNVVLTPHTGSNTKEANARMAQGALKNVARFFEGQVEELDRVDFVP